MKSSKDYFHLLYYKAIGEIKGEMSRNYLGLAWWVLEPVLFLGAFYVVFGIVLERGGEGFVAFLLVGLVVWKWFDAGVRQAMGAIWKNRAVINEVYIPKFILPLIYVASTGFRFLVVFALLVVFILLYGASPSLSWFWLPALILLQGILIAGVGMLVGAWIPLIQDARPLVENGLVMMFFLSGIFYDIGELEGTLKFAFMINPEVIVIDAFRQVLMQGELTEIAPIGWVFVFAMGCMVLGLHTMKRYDRVYPKVL